MKAYDAIHPEIGTVSHMLVPVYPVLQRPHGMLRLVPPNKDPRVLTTDGHPLQLISHRGWRAFRLLPLAGDAAPDALQHICQSRITPHEQAFTYLESGAEIRATVTEHAAILTVAFDGATPLPRRCHLRTCGRGALQAAQAPDGSWRITGADTPPVATAFRVCLAATVPSPCRVAETETGLTIELPEGADAFELRYAVSLISPEEAAAHLARELPEGTTFDAVAEALRDAWTECAGTIETEGGTDAERAVFYTALFRCRERPVLLSENGRYFSAYDDQVHDDGEAPFWADDWSWDTYRALHPLNCILEPEQHRARLLSYVRMAEQSGAVPTFPSPLGDSHCMLGFHPASILLDGFRKGLLREADAHRALDALRRTLETRSLVPWVKGPPNALDAFFWKHGFLPSLRPGERETVPEVNPGERRQSVAAVLDLSYDFWCCAELASELGREGDEAFFRPLARTNRNLWKADAGYYHPKDGDGRWIEPVDYTFGGGQGARDYYAENNGHIYAWGAPHDLPFVIASLGGARAAEARLDALFDVSPAGDIWDFYKLQPDATGLVGQYAMGNEPSLHIPYIYNRIGVPWKTQLRTRQLLQVWWRDDLMGVCGDDDGGGLSAWCIFTMLGLYPFLPGTLTYELTAPVFRKSVLHQPGRAPFTILAPAASPQNKFIQSVRLNGKPWRETAIPHAAILEGGTLEFDLGPRPSAWACS